MNRHPTEQTPAPPVPLFNASGVALWADDPVLIGRMALRAEVGARLLNGAVVIDGEDWRYRFERLVESMTWGERRQLRAAAVDSGGVFNAWKSLGIDPFLYKLTTHWFPELVNSRSLTPFYQPIVRVETGTVLGFEALIRGTMDGEMKAGGDIIDAARAHNALFQLDEQARVAAVAAGVPQLEAGEKLFVNFLPLTIRDPASAFELVWEALRKAKADPSCLVFEVVESEAFPDIAMLKAIVSEIRARGAKVALDDLGTGNAALVYVDELLPDYIKLAKGLIPDYPHQRDLLLVRGLVDHAHLRGIKVIAEGMETIRQWQAVVSLEVDYVQGWLVGKADAVPRRDLGVERLLAA
jgi:EAL domain-containing protein (putative c-di-GMP-specific phosphodiesterase class I)